MYLNSLLLLSKKVPINNVAMDTFVANLAQIS